MFFQHLLLSIIKRTVNKFYLISMHNRIYINMKNDRCFIHRSFFYQYKNLIILAFMFEKTDFLQAFLKYFVKISSCKLKIKLSFIPLRQDAIRLFL